MATNQKPPLGLPASLDGASEEQLAFADLLRNGPRKSVPSPFLAMMDAPALADAIQAVGVSLRWGSSIAGPLRELAILTTASAVNCAYEWNYHRPIALSEGVPWEVVRATHGQQNLSAFAADHRLVIAFLRAMALRGPDVATLRDEAIARFGRRVASELVAIAGYYAMLATFIQLAGHDNSPFNLTEPS